MNRNRVRSLLFPPGLAVLAFAGAAGATDVPYPYVDIVQQGGDPGVVAVGATPTVTLTGSAEGIVYGPGNINDFATPAAFTLSATYSASLTAADHTPGDYDYGDGTLTIGPTSNPLLTASFSDLVMQSGQTSLFQFVIAASSLDYTGGTLAGALGGGEILGSFTVDSYQPNALGNADLSQDFTGSDFTAKVGPVVPLPGTLPLLIGGLGVVALLARRPLLARAG